MSKFFILLFLLTLISLNELSAKITNEYTVNFNYEVVNEISPLTIKFFDKSICTNGDIYMWNWDFGNGETSNRRNPKHQYFHEGNYTVVLKIITDKGSTLIKKKIITLTNSKIKNCISFFTFMIDSTTKPYTYNFTDHSVSSISQNSWYWDFGDDTPVITQQNPSHQFADTGFYDITLFCITADSCYSYYTESIHIVKSALNCNALFKYSHINDTRVSFTDLSSTNDPITSWQWYFEDGSTSTIQNPVRDFPYADIYNISLVITTDRCTDSITMPIIIGSSNNYSVWGRVYVGNLTTDQCQAFLYRKYHNNQILPFDTVSLISVNDSLGIYYFHQIPEGEYYIQLRLPKTSEYDEDYCPTYYGDSPFWSQSKIIQVFSDKSNMHINMQAISHETGYNYISGYVFNSENGIIKDVLTLLYNKSGDVVDYTYSDNIGKYAFENVGSGSYSVYGELTGFISIPAVTPTLTNYDSITNVNFIIENNIFNGYIILDEESSKNNYKIYPNPIVNNKFFIKFDNNITEQINYSIINAIGIEIENGILDANKKGFNIKLQNNLSSGVYLISIRNIDGEIMGTKKVIIN